MLKIIDPVLRIYWLIGIGIILNACAATGPLFKPITKIPNDKAVVYVYRAERQCLSGLTRDLFVNKIKVLGLKNYGYTSLLVAPGNYIIEIKDHPNTEHNEGHEIELKIEKGKNYYLRFNIVCGRRTSFKIHYYTSFTKISERNALLELEFSNLFFSKIRYQEPIAKEISPLKSGLKSQNTNVQIVKAAGAAQSEETLVPTAGDTFKDCAECPRMVVVPAGDFMMGSPNSEPGRYGRDSPQHRVTISQPFAVVLG